MEKIFDGKKTARLGTGKRPAAVAEAERNIKSVAAGREEWGGNGEK